MIMDKVLISVNGIFWHLLYYTSMRVRLLRHKPFTYIGIVLVVSKSLEL
jgi:hypothetical protein